MTRVETFGGATVYLADCREMLGRLPRAGAIVSDPPYGMGANLDSTRFSSGSIKRGRGRDDWSPIVDDKIPFDPTPWLAFDRVVLFGANHFGARLPVGSTLVWIKKADALFGTFLSDAEIAWSKGGHGVYCFRKQFPPPSRMAESPIDGPAHPTQKPIALMQWCIATRASAAKGDDEHPVIIDPYMGSGTTGVAALKMGRRFIGVEIHEAHFDVACRRLSEAARQGDLFHAGAGGS